MTMDRPAPATCRLNQADEYLAGCCSQGPRASKMPAWGQDHAFARARGTAGSAASICPDIGHQRDVPGVAQIDTAIREPNQIKALTQLSVLAP
jgi:hypothetical protein